MNGYHKYTIPCSLLDIQSLERFLEMKAEQGHLIRGFSKWSGIGKFEKVLEEKYHICVDIYRKRLDEKDEGDPEFLEYIDECGTAGWNYSCFYKNLVIFYSKREERPVELKRNRIAAKQYLYDITRPEEKKVLFRQALNSFSMIAIWFIILILGFLKIGRSQDVDSWIYCMIFLTGLVFSGISGVIAKYIQNMRIGKALVTGKEQLFRTPFWDEDMVMAMSLLVTGFALFMWGQWIFAVKSAILSSCAVIISAAILFAGSIRYRMGREWTFPSAVRACCIAPLVLLAVSVGTNPSMGSYRFQIRPGVNYSDQVSQEEVVEALGLRPEVLGWKETDFTFLHENKNPLCTYEYLIYNVEGFQQNFQDSRDYEKSLRYIGTVSAKLKNGKSLNSYLRQKEISLKRCYPIEILPEVDSYIEESGKVMIHRKEDRIILFFLNEYDDRNFDVIDPGKLEIYRESLSDILNYENLR